MNVQISAGNSKFKLQSLKADDFPFQPVVKEECDFDMNSESFLELIKKTAFAIGGDDSRYVLGGLLMYFKASEKGASVRFVGTDGHRLAIAAAPVSSSVPLAAGAPPFEKKLIVPKKVILELKKVISEGIAENVHLGAGENQLVVKYGSVLLFARLLEGNYPDYAKIVPEKFSQKATFKKEELVQAIRRVSSLSDARTRAVKMEIDEEKAVLSTESVESGQAEDQIAVDFSGAKIKTGFNSRYLLESLSAFDQDQVDIEFLDGLKPTAFKTPADPNYLCIVMPMHV
jgi:DNA polymerase-3 subunit beta